MNTVLMVFKSVCISKSSWLCLCSFLYLVLLVPGWLSQMSITDTIVRGEKDVHIPANIMNPNTVNMQKNVQWTGTNWSAAYIFQDNINELGCGRIQQRRVYLPSLGYPCSLCSKSQMLGTALWPQIEPSSLIAVIPVESGVCSMVWDPRETTFSHLPICHCLPLKEPTQSYSLKSPGCLRNVFCKWKRIKRWMRPLCSPLQAGSEAEARPWALVPGRPSVASPPGPLHGDNSERSLCSCPLRILWESDLSNLGASRRFVKLFPFGFSDYAFEFVINSSLSLCCFVLHRRQGVERCSSRETRFPKKRKGAHGS